ncbi:MAG: tetratricopeptide repeat protein [Chloroflexi bacterium]|nr:tetratricopeptide repeat protein [Chloroflexota bacterium]
MSETMTSQPISFFNNEERFKQLIGILIAGVTVLTAIVGLLQNDAGSRDDRANRQAQTYAFQAMGQRISGATRVGYDRGDAYRNWSELDTLALAAKNAGDANAAERYFTAAEEIARLSPLLSATYFDPETDQLNVAKYEADTYLVKVTGLAERSAAWFAVKQAWDEKANTYVVHLTILAVSLFLLGLATTISGRVRWIFVVSGLLITLITMAWVLVVFLKPVPELPDTAIDTFAAGVGLSYQGDSEKALAAFDQALVQAPDYANALFERGSTYSNMNNYQAAVTDFEAARAAGRDDASVAWNLAWLYYLQGRFDESVQTNRQTIEKDPTLLEARFDLALALLTSGQMNAAKTEYAQALALAAEQLAQAEAAGQEPPASLWWSFDEAAASLDGVLDLTEGFADSWWSETPPLEKINNPDEVTAAAEEIVAQIKGTSVALEYTGKPLSGALAAKISPFTFAKAEYDEEGNFVDYVPADSFPAGANEVLIVFDYEGMQDGQEAVWKVYYNGEEDISWRTVEEWSLGSTGSAEFPLSYAYSNVYTLASGEYLVEMYVDSHLAQRGYFNINAEETSASN